MSTREPTLRVIGAGSGRTGTASLKRALEVDDTAEFEKRVLGSKIISWVLLGPLVSIARSGDPGCAGLVDAAALAVSIALDAMQPGAKQEGATAEAASRSRCPPRSHFDFAPTSWRTSRGQR